MIYRVPQWQRKYVLGDFNAHVGADSEEWQNTLGNGGVDKMNTNGKLLLELCKRNELYLRNTDADVDEINKMTFFHAKYNKWYQIDYIIIHFDDKINVSDIESISNCEKKSDHLLLCSTVKIPRLFHTEISGYFTNRADVIRMLLHQCENIQDSYPLSIYNSWREIKRKSDFDYKKYARLFDTIYKCLETVSSVRKKLKNINKKYLTDKTDTSFKSLLNVREETKKTLFEQANNLCEEREKNLTLKEGKLIDFLIKQCEFEEYLQSTITHWGEITTYEESFESVEFSKCMSKLTRMFTRLDETLIRNFFCKCFNETYIPIEVLFSKCLRICEHTRNDIFLKEVLHTIACFVTTVLESTLDRIPTLESNLIFTFNVTKEMINKIRLLEMNFKSRKEPLHLGFINLSHILDLSNLHILLMFLFKAGHSKKLLIFIYKFLGHIGNIPLENKNGISKALEEKDQDTFIAPLLFQMFFSYVFNIAFKSIDPVVVRNQTNKEENIRGLFSGDSLVIIAKSQIELQKSINELESALNMFCLGIEYSNLRIVAQNCKYTHFCVKERSVKYLKEVCFKGHVFREND